ncbi:TfoX/Sxy family protein [Ruegeria arenilitoris]|uniref:TfoX/Sxy family protein n=1 Tax=Ruegeria arenilitoris TaxID=1173585 RepID=UPI00147A2C08|nr:TfoX/Sxy family protein [Ruegeria arenilitoris]
MSDPVSSIRNLGPAFEQACTRAGIHSAQQLRELGADEAYSRLLEAGTKAHFIGYYVLVMGLQGRPWNDCKGEEKKALRQRFDQIKTGITKAPQSKLVSELDAIGVRVAPKDLKPV